MRTRILTTTFLFLGAAIVACGGARSSGAGVGFAGNVGVYRFEEQVSPELYLEGRFLVQTDTIEAELKTGPCRIEIMQTRTDVLTYNCGGDVWLRFDRLHPVLRATYTAQVMVTETRSVCARYVTNTAGQTVCAEYKRESYQRLATRSGRLRPQRLENADWGQ